MTETDDELAAALDGLSGLVAAENPLEDTLTRIAANNRGITSLDARGHSVTVFEAAPRAGGLLRYGIPDFKMEKHVIDRRLALTPDIAIRCNADAASEDRTLG